MVLQEIWRAENPTEAHMIVGMLRSEGIAAEVGNETLYGMRGEAPLDSSTLPTVLVPGEADRELVDRLIRDFLSARSNPLVPPEELGTSWTCPECGEDLEPQFANCWNCGTERGATPSSR